MTTSSESSDRSLEIKFIIWEIDDALTTKVEPNGASKQRFMNFSTGYSTPTQITEKANNFVRSHL